MSTTQFFEYLHHPATSDLAAALEAILAGRSNVTAGRHTTIAEPAPERVSA